jgi:hypothetical protein
MAVGTIRDKGRRIVKEPTVCGLLDAGEFFLWRRLGAWLLLSFL